MIKNLIQTTLDNVLYEKGIYVFDQRKTGHDLDQYVVYSISGDIREAHADDEVILKNANITIRYFYRVDLLDTYEGRQAIWEEGRQAIWEIEDLIEEALENAGIRIPFGRFDGGDIDDIGYFTTIFECEYWRVV